MQMHTARLLATQLMAEHGILQQGWRFEFNTRKRAFGLCNFRWKRIELSHPLTVLNEEPEVRDTILHEIAHAIAGPQAGHGLAWRAVCYRIGAKAERCFTQKDVATPAAPIQGTCPRCQKVHGRYRMPKRRLWCACYVNSLTYLQRRMPFDQTQAINWRRA